MLAASHVVVVEVHQGLNGLLHGRHLEKSHFVISKVGRGGGGY